MRTRMKSNPPSLLGEKTEDGAVHLETADLESGTRQPSEDGEADGDGEPEDGEEGDEVLQDDMKGGRSDLSSGNINDTANLKNKCDIRSLLNRQNSHHQQQLHAKNGPQINDEEANVEISDDLVQASVADARDSAVGSDDNEETQNTQEKERPSRKRERSASTDQTSHPNKTRPKLGKDNDELDIRAPVSVETPAPPNPYISENDTKTRKEDRRPNRRRASNDTISDIDLSDSNTNSRSDLQSKSLGANNGGKKWVQKHVCQYEGCGKTFTTSAHLSRHAKLHIGIKPHRCPLPECNKGFARRDNMMVHYRAHARKLGLMVDSIGNAVPDPHSSYYAQSTSQQPSSQTQQPPQPNSEINRPVIPSLSQYPYQPYYDRSYPSYIPYDRYPSHPQPQQAQAAQPQQHYTYGTSPPPTHRDRTKAYPPAAVPYAAGYAYAYPRWGVPGAAEVNMGHVNVAREFYEPRYVERDGVGERWGYDRRERRYEGT
ncbi:transcriptional repressor [Gaertneriomyces sp. JEL0708]|nr:transcriptional repressor [Gaertneriomyces sp. JEL0708]